MKRKIAKIEKKVSRAMTYKRTFHVVYSITGTILFVYAIFISSITLNVIERGSLENDAQGLKSEIASLEIEYLSSEGNIDLDYSQQLGFIVPRDRGYATSDVLVVRDYKLASQTDEI